MNLGHKKTQLKQPAKQQPGDMWSAYKKLSIFQCFSTILIPCFSNQEDFEKHNFHSLYYENNTYLFPKYKF